MTESSFNASERSLFSLTQIQHLMRVEFNRAQRYDYPIVCLMISVDRLGHLRDLYGYEAKEEIIDEVVALLKAQTRSSDFLGRMADDRLGRWWQRHNQQQRRQKNTTKIGARLQRV